MDLAKNVSINANQMFRGKSDEQNGEIAEAGWRDEPKDRLGKRILVLFCC